MLERYNSSDEFDYSHWYEKEAAYAFQNGRKILIGIGQRRTNKSRKVIKAIPIIGKLKITWRIAYWYRNLLK